MTPLASAALKSGRTAQWYLAAARTSRHTARTAHARIVEKAMAAYLVCDINVTNPTQYEEYKKLAQAAVAQYGGRYLARGGEKVVLEGSWQPNRVVVLEFQDLARARAFYDSPEYKAARKARAGAAKMNMVAVAGA
jgi:uncharacterized protein (DUF1330 family)